MVKLLVQPEALNVTSGTGQLEEARLLQIAYQAGLQALKTAQAIPTIKIEVRDGKVVVKHKDQGVRLVIWDFDQEDASPDIYNEWEVFSEPHPGSRLA